MCRKEKMIVDLKTIFRISINGGFKDFDTFEELINYLRESWVSSTCICSIRKIHIYSESQINSINNMEKYAQ